MTTRREVKLKLPTGETCWASCVSQSYAKLLEIPVTVTALTYHDIVQFREYERTYRVVRRVSAGSQTVALFFKGAVTAVTTALRHAGCLSWRSPGAGIVVAALPVDLPRYAVVALCDALPGIQAHSYQADGASWQAAAAQRLREEQADGRIE